MENYPLIRKIYLYLFSMVGLVLVIIGCVNFIDMGLKAFVFTQAEGQDRLNYSMPQVSVPYTVEAKLNNPVDSTVSEVKLTTDEYQQMKAMANDYKNWQENQKKFDFVSANRQKRASINLALIFVGIPLYLYHWLMIRRELKA